MLHPQATGIKPFQNSVNCLTKVKIRIHIYIHEVVLPKEDNHKPSNNIAVILTGHVTSLPVIQSPPHTDF